MASILNPLASWASGLAGTDIPADVRARAIRHLADGIGVALAAAEEAVLLRTADQFAPANHNGKCALITGGMTESPSNAVLVNGMAAHIYDYDDTSFLGVVHGTAAIWPTALAAGQATDASGKALLEAFITGSEVEYCLGEALGNGLYRRGWWASATLGIFGAAAAVAKIHQATASQMETALLLAAGHAFGVRSVFGGASKPFLLGRAAQAGYDCAMFALADLDAPRDVFDGASGFVEVFNEGILDQQILQQAGDRFRLTEPGVAIKKFPVCSATQAGTEAVQELMKLHHLTAADVDHVEMRVTELVHTQLRYLNARTVEEARFCLPFTVAAILDRGRLGLEELTEEYVNTPSVRRWMERVEMIPDDGILDEADDPAAAPEGAKAILHLKNGDRVSLFNPAATGMPGKEISEKDLMQKFIHCVSRIRSEAEALEIFNQIQNLETGSPDLWNTSPLKHT